MKVSGVKQKNPASLVKNNAYQNSQEYFKELDSKFGDTLQDNEDGVEQVIRYLEENVEPLVSIQEDREKLNQYIAALKLWVKVSGDKQKNQAKMVKTMLTKIPKNILKN